MRIVKKLSCAALLLSIFGSIGCVPAGSKSTGEPEPTAEEKKAKLIKANIAYLIKEKKLPAGTDGYMLEGALFPKNADLTGADLTDANLTGANLTDANLTSANLTDANLTSANLTDANLTGANLTDANLTSADLRNANFNKATLNNVDLSNAKLNHTNFAEATLNNIIFTNTQFKSTNFTDATFSDATDFSVIKKKINLGNYPSAKFTNATLNKAIFDGLALMGSSSFEKAKINEGSFIGCDLYQINMMEAELNGSNFTDSKLEYPKFVSAQLKNANFTNASFQLYLYDSKEGFKDADISNANFKGAKKTGNELITLDILTNLQDKPTWLSGEPTF